MAPDAAEDEQDQDEQDQDQQDQPVVGGVVDQMAWSPTSERLAVSFRGVRPGWVEAPAASRDGSATHSKPCSSELIAVFATHIRRSGLLSAHLVGFIRGPAAQDGVGGRRRRLVNKPQKLAFRPHFDQGALLVVVWGEGQISHYPMYFRQQRGNQQFGNAL